MTNPSNIDSPLLRTARTIRGVGTALIREAERICIREKADGLIVHPDPSSIVFYQNLGFRQAQDGDFLVKTLTPRFRHADGRVTS
jgi:predicted N-acetyltransferase YhbS